MAPTLKVARHFYLDGEGQLRCRSVELPDPKALMGRPEETLAQRFGEEISFHLVDAAAMCERVNVAVKVLCPGGAEVVTFPPVFPGHFTAVLDALDAETPGGRPEGFCEYRIIVALSCGPSFAPDREFEREVVRTVLKGVGRRYFFRVYVARRSGDEVLAREVGEEEISSLLMDGTVRALSPVGAA
jgi:hypothetical protein